jgi:hypothetical protein
MQGKIKYPSHKTFYQSMFQKGSLNKKSPGVSGTLILFFLGAAFLAAFLGAAFLAAFFAIAMFLEFNC